MTTSEKIKIRHLQIGDYATLDKLLNAEKQLTVQRDGFTHILSHHSELMPQVRWGVWLDERLVGFAGYVFAETDPELAIISLIIAPVFRRQGLASKIFSQLIAEAEKRGACRFLTDIFQTQTGGLQFALQNQFVAVGSSRTYILDLTTAEMTEEQDAELQAWVQGFRLTSLDHLPEKGLAERLLPIWNETRKDQPQPWPFAPYSRRRFEQEILLLSEIALHYSFVITNAEKEIVALHLSIFAEEKHLFSFYSAVGRAYRGRGLATTLKRKLIETARADGVLFVSAENDTNNSAMCHINEKLGYKSISTLITHELRR